MMLTCGLWPGARRIIAVIADAQGNTRPPITASYTDEAVWGILQYIAYHDAQPVLSNALICRNSLGKKIADEGLPLWQISDGFFEQLRIAAALTKKTGRYSAAMLARLPYLPMLRNHLERINPLVAKNQLSLL